LLIITIDKTTKMTNTKQFLIVLATLVAINTFAQNRIEPNNYTSSAQWICNILKDNVKLTYSFSLQQTGGTSLNVSLAIQNNTTAEVFDYGTVQFKEETILNKTELQKLLKNKYSELFNRYGRQVLLNHIQYLNFMVSSVRDTLKDKNHYSFVYQALRFFQTVTNASNRDTKNKGEVPFTIFGGYTKSICSFVCEEDMVFNIGDFKRYLVDRKVTDSNNKGIDYYLESLRDVNSDSLRFSEISQLLETYFTNSGVAINPNPMENSDATNARWPQGGECGCCGNYSGNCYFWSRICLAHDMACQRCQWDLCFRGCVPSSCSGNTISWYWWIL
jgi:hypothetical protein